MTARWQAVEDALRAGAPALAARADRYPRWFADAVVDRSRRYTSERERLDRPADREADLAARALFFSPVDAAKLQVPIAELLRARGGALGATAPRVRVLDLGAGCGAMTLGLLAATAARGARPAWQVTAVDRDAAALAIARGAIEHLAQELGLDVEVHTVTAELTRWPLPPADLVLAGGVLNELPEPQSRALVHAALAAVDAAGAIVLIDPALRESARRLHQLRDELLAAGAAHVLAPCVRQTTPCPMLARPTDWCHEDRRFRPPEGVRAVADVTHLRDGNLKFAYLVLSRAPAPLAVPAPGSLLLRVVSGALPGKGRRELMACGEPGRVPLRRLDRRASPQNAWFDELYRGDLVEVPEARALAAAAPGGRVEVAQDDTFPVLRFGGSTDEPRD